MPPEAALIGVFFIGILVLWAYVTEVELHKEETKADGDNT